MKLRLPQVRRSLIASIVSLLASMPIPHASAQTPDQILHSVDSHYNHLTSLRTRFAERYIGLGLDRSETGTLTLRKPGRMAWHYDHPQGKIFLLDGRYAWSYTPGDPQATRLPAKQLDDLRTPLRFLLGHTQLKKELDHLDITPSGPDFRIAGIPHDPRGRIKDIILLVTPAGLILSLKIDDLDGASTEFAFTDIVENVPTRDADFTFTPPLGVAIVEATPPL